MTAITANKIFTFTGHRDCIYAMGEGLRPGTFITGGADGWVVEWDWQNPGDGKLLVQVNAPLYSFLLIKENETLLCGTRAGNLHVVDMAEAKETRNIEAHSAGVFDMLQLDANRLVTASGDGTLKVWNTDLALLNEINASYKSARVLALHPSKPEIAVGYSDYSIRVFDTGTFDLLTEIKGHTNSVFALAYSPDGKHLLSGGRDAVLRIWNADNYAPLQTINAHWYHINCIRYSPSGRWFATVSMDKTVKIWDAQSFDLLKVLDKLKNDGHTTSVNKILWADDYRLISCSDDRTAVLWAIGL
ncbi:MAG TPA: WD40 repeat domain-containing protein [Bacteroidia bacterium]|nr:WD40 repeat domain-containing protein [Bacteroidia bacterium]